MINKRKLRLITAIFLAFIMSVGSLPPVLAESTNIIEEVPAGNEEPETDMETPYNDGDSDDSSNEEDTEKIEEEDETAVPEELENPEDNSDDLPEEPEISELLPNNVTPLSDMSMQPFNMPAAFSGTVIDLGTPGTHNGPGHTFSNNCITIAGGGIYSISDSGSTTDIRIEVTTGEDVTLILNNIEISINTDGAPISLMPGANVTMILPDGTSNLLSSAVNQYAGIRVPDGAQLIIDIPQDDKGTGKLIAEGGFDENALNIKGGAGIGGNHQEDCGEIIIRNGTVFAYGVSGAAIGGGSGDATGGDANYGPGGSGGIIKIEGGTVTAEVWQKKAGNYSNSFNGAAIGGGNGGNGGTITISGGKVTAKGRFNGAAIGGGRGGIGETITITGGTVNAENIVFNPDNNSESLNSAQGAAIGNGSLESSSNPGGIRTKITISGDDTFVTAKAEYGASIGGSSQYYADAGNHGSFDVLIDGGSVRAENDSGAGIGTGYVLIGGTPSSNSTVGNDDFTVTINDGDVTANSITGSGIGGSIVESYVSNNPVTAPSGGTITINGGTVTAKSANSAGIGGGFGLGYSLVDGGSGGNITISGGSVNAQGGSGAGIGGGPGYYGSVGGDGGAIIIKGDPQITAVSTGFGAGIGGGGAYNTRSYTGNTTTANAGGGGSISISGNGEVKAQSANGAGIGGGSANNTANVNGIGGSGGNIHISGSTLVTASSSKSAGIGGGYSDTVGGDGGTVHIGGNTLVKSTGGTYSSGIGGACGSASSTDTTHIADSSYGVPSVLTMENTAEVYAYSQYGHALHTSNNEINGGAYVVNLYLWDGVDMDTFHDTDEIHILGLSEDKSHIIETKIPEGYTSFAYTGTDSTYLLNTAETISRSIVYYASGSEKLLSSKADAEAKAITFGAPPSTYSVTYDGNQGTGTVPQDNNIYNLGQKAIIMDNTGLTRSGYTFSGWTENPDGSGTVYTAGNLYLISDNVTFYALWKENAIVNPTPEPTPEPSPEPTPEPDRSSSFGGSSSKKQYTVTFLMNDGSNDIYLVKSISMGSKVMQPADPIRSGYVFTGWYLEENCSIPYNFSSIVTKNIELYAGWEPIFTDEHFSYISGYPDGTVRPENNITRGETAAIFYRLLDNNYRRNINPYNLYSDIDGNAWYSEAVSVMTAVGAVTGYPDSTFRPDSSITRGEFATVISSFLGETYDGENLFTDINGHWAAPFINSAASNGWILGYPGGIYQPDNYITRAEAVAIINRVLNRNPENIDDLSGEMIVWPDNADLSKWYYIDIQEASNSHEYMRKNNGTEKWQELYN